MSDKSYIYGMHAAMARLAEADGVQEMWVLKGRHDRRLQALLQQARHQNVRVSTTDRNALDEMAEGGNHQGVVLAVAAAAAPLATWSWDSLLEAIINASDAPLLLVLDGVQDPHNLGACLRTADATGAIAVVIPKDRAVGLTPAVRKAACGAAERVPLVVVTNLARSLSELRDAGMWMVGLAGEGEQSIYDVDFTGPMAVVMGGEERGLRRLTRDHCDHIAAIPMCGSVSSLNVSVAAAVALYEAVRQRAESR
jgi:23S rRNA (guanosine2251-2'-O)-methyltransferase